MDEKQKNLIQESSKEDSFSSHIHTIELNKEIIVQEDFEIPLKYNKNRLVLLPVNTTKYYFYWEFTSEFFNYNNKKLDSIVLRVMNEDLNEVLSFETSEELGEYFFTKNINDKNIFVEVGFYLEKEFIALLTTKTIKPFSKNITYTTLENEVWMEKQKGFSEIIKSSLDPNIIGLSSSEYAKEVRRIEEFIKTNIDSYSSKDLIKDDNE